MNVTIQGNTGKMSKRSFRFVGEHPVVGSLRAFGNDRLGLFCRMANEGDVCAMRLGPMLAVQFNHPNYARHILVEHGNHVDFDKGAANHRTFRPVIGNGILCSEGEFHDFQRAAMAPSFQANRVKDYAADMARFTEELVDGWGDDTVVDVHKEMMALSMRMIGKALFDADFVSRTNVLCAALEHTAAHISHSLTTTLFPVPYSWPLPRNLKTRATQRVMRGEITRLIEERRRNPRADRVDFLTLLVTAKRPNGQGMSDDDIMAECLTLFGAGQEPPASALTWAWYILGHYPEVYAKVLNEVDSVLGGRTPTHEDLPRLPYCLQVFKEALRLYPPAYMIGRRALHDTVIDGYQVPKGTFVMTNPYTLHRREDVFPDPERFDPDRFAPEREARIPRYNFMPFGAGPRICIGQHYALLIGHIGLATLAQRAKLTLIPHQVVTPDPYNSPSLRPGGAIHVRVQKRAAAEAAA